MTILVVDEDGERRGFRVSPGVLTIGSAEAAGLTLRSSDVAAEHAVLEVDADSIRIRALPGVAPPTVDGVPLAGEAVLEPGQVLALGGARLSLRLEPGEASPPAEAERARPPRDASQPRPPRQPRSPGTHGAKRQPVAAGGVVRNAGRATDADGTGATRPSRSRARSQPKGLPMGVTLLLAIVGVVVLGGLFLKFFDSASTAADDPSGISYTAIVGQARANIEAGDYGRARERLERFSAAQGLSAAQRAEVDELWKLVRESEQGRDLISENLAGTRYLNKRLRRFEDNYLMGTPEPPAVRLFLKRCAVFLERWPDHEERGWVERQQTRFAGLVDLSQPATFEDVVFEVDSLTRNKPRDYREAYALLDELIGRAQGDELILARNRRASLDPERAEYHLDRMQQARWEHEQGSDSKAVAWLVSGSVEMGDPEMERQAAEALILMPNAEGHLAGYHRDQPERYAELLRNPVLREFIEEQGLPTSVH